MSDPRDRSDLLDEPTLPAWATRLLRAPVATDPAAKRRLMRRVRAAAPGGGRLPGRVPRARSAWQTRRGLAPFAGLAAAAAFAGVTVLGAARLAPPAGGPGAAAALHDTLTAAAPALDDALGASLGGALLRDTLRLVRFALVAPGAARLALVGDFNGWNARATPMLAVAESTDVWSATVALRSGTHRYAFVVDDTGWMADPAAPRADSAGRPRSTLVVPAAPATHD